MGVDWDYLRAATHHPGEWGEEDLGTLYQRLVAISKVRSRDKTPEKLEMLFTLTQAVMMAKYTQVSALESEVEHLAEEAGRGDARRETQLLEEVTQLRARLRDNNQAPPREQDDIAYDWSSAWRIKRREMEEDLQRKNLEIHQFMDDLQACESERGSLRTSVRELEERLADATREITTVTAEYLETKESLGHAQESVVRLQGERQGLASRVEELLHDKARLQHDYQDLSQGVDARLDQLKVVVRQREDEVQGLRSQLHQTTIGVRSHTPDLTRITQLQQDVKDRDEEISRLSQQLTEAAREMDNSAALITSLRETKGGPAKEGVNVIKQLRAELSDNQKMMQQMRTQLLAAEEDAQLHAQDLSTVMGELGSYLAGEYSLADAVRELKEARGQVRARDTQISHLTALTNTLHININELLDENSELREQLRLEPRPDLDLAGVKKTHWQDTKKVIEGLKGQVNKLQDDKVTLRTKIYELTRELSNAKGSLQLTTLELHKPFGTESQVGNESLEASVRELSATVGQMLRGSATTTTTQDTHQQSHIQALQEQCYRLEGEKASLERVLHSNLTARKRKRKGEKTLRIEEEAEDLSDTSPDSSSSSSPASPHHHPPPSSRQHPQEDKGEGEKEWRPRSPTAALDDLIAALGHLPPSAEEVIAKLKAQIQFLIKECEKREGEISEREKVSQIYTAQFEDLRSQAAHLNTLLSKEQEKWGEEKQSLEKASHDLTDEVAALKALTGELQSAIDDVTSGRPDVDAKLARRLAELRYDLEIKKRLSENQEREVSSVRTQLKDRLQELHNSLVQSKQVKQEWEAEREILSQRARGLERELDGSVPQTASDTTAAHLAATTAKYRTLLHDHARMCKECESEASVDVERRQLLQEREEMRERLESAREKVHSLQASLNLVGANKTHIQVEVLSKQLAAVESRELRERQKADHATSMYASLKKEREELTRRLEELKSSHDATVDMNQKLQANDTDLRLRLQQAVSREEYTRVTSEVTALQQEKAELLGEMRRLQAVVEVAGVQGRQRQVVEAVGEAEVEQLRRENRDLAALSEPRTTISRLHHEITLLKVRVLETSGSLEESEAGQQRTEGEVWGLRRQVRQRDRLLETAAHQHRTRATRLHHIISELRQQYVGAVPLSQQERTVEALSALHEERTALHTALKSALHDKLESRVALRQLKVKQEALEELKAALEASDGSSEHVSAWCDRVKELRLVNAELEEKVVALEESGAVSQTRLEAREKRLSHLQDQLTALEKTWTDAQLVWDQREEELSRTVQHHRDTQARDTLDIPALTLNDTLDTKLPLATQLHNTLDTLQLKTTQLGDVKTRLEKCRAELETAQEKLSEREIEVLARDKVINELRCLSSSSKDVLAFSEKKMDVPEVKEGRMEEESIKVVIEGLRERLRLSHDTVSHYQDLLAKEHEKQLSMAAQSKEELSRLAKDKEAAVVKLRQAQAKLDDIPTRDPTTSTTLREEHISQLLSQEEALRLCERQLQEARSNINTCERKIVQLERDLAIARRQYAEEKEQLEVSGQVRMQQHQRELDRLSGELTKVRGERDNFQDEVNLLREAAARTPSAILRTLVEKLRDQLIEKEKQVAKLTMAVQEMKERIMMREEQASKDDTPSREKDSGQETSKITEAFKLEIEKITASRNDLEKQLNQQNISFSEIKDKSITEIQNLKEDLKSLKSENLKVEKQMLHQKNTNNTLKHKLEDLEGRSPEAIARAIENLRDKLEKINGTEEVRESENRRARTQEQVARWEERKKLRGTIDKLKDRVKELETLQEVNGRKLETSRELLRKMEREKMILKEKLSMAGKAATDKLCRVCLKTLSSVDLGKEGESPHHQSPEVLLRSSRTGTPVRQLRRNRVSPSPERTTREKERDDGRERQREGDEGRQRDSENGRGRQREREDNNGRDNMNGASQTRVSQAERDESEIRLRRQIKSAVEEKHAVESRLQGAVEEITALRNRMQQKEEEQEQWVAERNRLVMGRSGTTTGAALVLQYEARINSLEEEVRQKARLLIHIKQVVRDAVGREEGLKREKNMLVGKVALLEGVSEDTPAARLVQELRQAKLTITRLQRELDRARDNSTAQE